VLLMAGALLSFSVVRDKLGIGATESDTLDLNRALDRLEQIDARKTRILELRFFSPFHDR
jgi:hypothetical protein